MRRNDRLISRISEACRQSGASTRTHGLIFAILVLMAAGCDRLDMYDQARYEPLEASSFFKDGQSARSPVEGTIARGKLREDEAYFTGKVGKQLLSQIPDMALRGRPGAEATDLDDALDDEQLMDLRRKLMERGRERYDIYCSVCHGRTGEGDGIVVRRGFRRPPSFHTDRLRTTAAGHFFDVMTHGFGAMSSYANRIEARDRWAIVAYIRALQLSQNAKPEDVPEDQRSVLVPGAESDKGVSDSTEAGR